MLLFFISRIRSFLECTALDVPIWNHIKLIYPTEVEESPIFRTLSPKNNLIARQILSKSGNNIQNCDWLNCSSCNFFSRSTVRCWPIELVFGERNTKCEEPVSGIFEISTEMPPMVRPPFTPAVLLIIWQQSMYIEVMNFLSHTIVSLGLM